jgi:DNA polymerase III epsilon subunit-like protein
MYLFFDTETNGLPHDWQAPITESDNWPRILQIAWILTDAEGNAMESSQHLIAPEGPGFRLDAGAAAVHGLTLERLGNEGRWIKDVLADFGRALEKARVIVAHNLSFDQRIVGAELLRLGMEAELGMLQQKVGVCTMESGVRHCALPGRRGGYKWPKLQELHHKLFAEDFAGAHDALNDVQAAARCFWELRRLNAAGQCWITFYGCNGNRVVLEQPKSSTQQVKIFSAMSSAGPAS